MAAYDVTALGTELEFATDEANSKSVVRIPGLDRIAVAWIRSTFEVMVQAFNVNTSTGSITAIGSPIDIESGTLTSATIDGISLVAIDGSNLAVFWTGPSDDGFCQLLSLDGTGNVSTNGSKTEYQTTNGEIPRTVLWDSTHILATYQGTSTKGFSAIFTVNTGAGTISLTGTPNEFSDPNLTSFASQLIKLSSTKALVIYGGTGDDGYARVIDVNTSTWATSNAGAEFEYRDSITVSGASVVAMDTASSPMRVIMAYGNGSSAGYARSFSIDTSTWAITTYGSEFNVSSIPLTGTFSLQKVDDTHALLIFRNNTTGGTNAKVLEYDTGTGAISNAANNTVFYAFDPSLIDSCAFAELPGFFVAVFTGFDGDGFAKALQVELVTGFTMTADLGTFALTGVSSNLLFGRKLVAALGTFTLTGIVATLRKGFGMVASAGSYAVTGIATTLSKGYGMIASVGSFALTGVAAAFQKGFGIVASAGEFVLTGINAVLRASNVWENPFSKSVSSFYNQTRNVSDMTNASKSDSDWENVPKS